jgi:hypothetical protein
MKLTIHLHLMMTLIITGAIPTYLLGIHKDNFTADKTLNSRSVWCMCYAVLFSILLRANSNHFWVYEIVEALLTHYIELTMHIQQCKNSQTKYV